MADSDADTNTDITKYHNNDFFLNSSSAKNSVTFSPYFNIVGEIQSTYSASILSLKIQNKM